MTKQFASIKRAMTSTTNDIEEMITADTAANMQSYLREVLARKIRGVFRFRYRHKSPRVVQVQC